ncbi:MAG: TonB-dependent receptor [Sterolibacteriaceae bacterium]|nr:TonB-dependent receptor [Sterolibacteriaceae bacterium]
MRRPVTPAPQLGPQRRVAGLALAAALALGGTGPMYAAGDDLTSLPLEALLGLTVFSASKFEQKISDAPSAVTVITAADIRTFGYRTIADALRSIRGLYVFNDRNYDFLGARGFQRPGDYNSRILLLVDGQRVNDGIYDQAQIGRDFLLDPELIERIEYVPGPGSAIYGGNAFFGVINVITRSGDGLGTVVAGETASHRTARGQVMVGKRLDNGADLLLAASKYGSRGPNLSFPEFAEPEVSDGIAHGLDFERAERYFAKLRHDGLTLSLGYANRLKGIPTASYGQVFDDPRSRTGDEQTWVAASLERNLSDTLALSANLSWRRYRYDGTYIIDYPPVTENFDGGRDRWWSGELKLVSTAFARHKLVAGGEMRRDMGALQFNFDSQGEYVHDARSSRRLGLYLQDEFTLNEQWIVNAGIRRDSNYLDSPQTSPRLADLQAAAHHHGQAALRQCVPVAERLRALLRRCHNRQGQSRSAAGAHPYHRAGARALSAQQLARQRLAVLLPHRGSGDPDHRSGRRPAGVSQCQPGARQGARAGEREGLGRWNAPAFELQPAKRDRR